MLYLKVKDLEKTFLGTTEHLWLFKCISILYIFYRRSNIYELVGKEVRSTQEGASSLVRINMLKGL